MKYSITNDTVTVVIDGEIYTIHAGAKNFSDLKKALVADETQKVMALVSPGVAVDQWSRGEFRVVRGQVVYRDQPVPHELDTRILAMVEAGEDPSVLTNFWVKLQKNPSYRSVEQLFKFLVHQGIPLTPEGDILAYKSVTDDYKDHHTGKFDNTPGTTNEMPRNRISDDPNMACHEGFHVGSLAYARTFGPNDRKLVICQVDPADVVCVPYDESAQKVRVCKYTVAGDFGEELPSTVFRSDGSTKESDGYPRGALSGDRFEDDDGTGLVYDEEEDDCFDEDLCGDCGECLSECYCDDEEEEDLNDYEEEEEEEEEEDSLLDAWDYLNCKTPKELREESTRTLREYARDLGIKGASKIAGGKKALIRKIDRIRRTLSLGH